MLVFDTTVSADALVGSLARAGLRGEMLLAPADIKVEGAMPVIRAHLGNRAVTWHALGLNQLLYELAEPDALARGLREVLLMDDPADYPELVYAKEAANWFTTKCKGRRRKQDSLLRPCSHPPSPRLDCPQAVLQRQVREGNRQLRQISALRP